MSVTPEITERRDPSPGVKDAQPEPRVKQATGFGALLLRLHFYAGILIAPFLVVAAVTGLLFTVTPQLDAIIYGDQLTVSARGPALLPLAEQVAAARTAHPDGSLSAIQPGAGDTTTKVVFSLPELGENQHIVYVNPYTGTIQGTLTTWWGSTPVTTWLDDLHRNLHLGVAGRHYSELAASWLWILALGGLVLWWRRRRSVRRMFTPELSAKKGVRRTRGWHAATGVWISVGLLILSATGLTWSRYAGGNFTAVLDTFNAHSPELSTSLTAAPSSGGGHHGGAANTTAVDPAAADTVLTVARANGLTGPVELTVPEEPGSAWTVGGIDNTWPVDLDRVAVDPATSTVVARSDFADWPLLSQLSKLGVQAHMGRLFGVVNQILLAALAIGLLCVIVWGYRMWWQRRPIRTDRRALVGAPPVGPGAWRQLPAWGIAIGVPVVFAIAWALPMFGIPLVAFLAVDLAVGAIRGRRDQPTTPVSPAAPGG